MAVKFIKEKNTRRKTPLTYYRLIFMILCAGIVVLFIFAANKAKKKLAQQKDIDINRNLSETIYIRLDGFEDK